MVVVWRDPDRYQKKQVFALIYKAKYWSRKISSSVISRHLVWQSRKCAIWWFLAYMIPAANFFISYGGRISLVLR